jgi:predicted DCC family thiol-disulfide oxidoreductase YuxK
MNTLTIFYDAHCGLCSRFRRWMLDQAAYVRLEFLPYDSETARKRCPDLPSLRADKEIVVMGVDGSLWQGAAAWVTCLWALREYREWSLRLATPGMLGIGVRRVDRLCEDILDPNRNVDAHFHLHTFTMKDSSVMAGFLVGRARPGEHPRRHHRQRTSHLKTRHQQDSGHSHLPHASDVRPDDG